MCLSVAYKTKSKKQPKARTLKHPEILKVFNKSIDYLLLTESQAKAIKINDRFLVIGVIGKCSSLSAFVPNILTNEITLTATKFPKNINPHRNVQKCVDIYEVYSILNWTNLLEHAFKFTVKLGDSLLVYYQIVQKQIWQELEELLFVSISKTKSHFTLFEANIYTFTFGAFPYADIAALETQPISFDLGRNGNGIIVRSQSCYQSGCSRD